MLHAQETGAGCGCNSTNQKHTGPALNTPQARPSRVQPTAGLCPLLRQPCHMISPQLSSGPMWLESRKAFETKEGKGVVTTGGKGRHEALRFAVCREEQNRKQKVLAPAYCVPRASRHHQDSASLSNTLSLSGSDFRITLYFHKTSESQLKE